MANAICGSVRADPDLYGAAIALRSGKSSYSGFAAVEQHKQTSPPTEEAMAALLRYERRALSRRNRAIRMFEATSIVNGFLRCQTKGN